jgi:chitosanase
MNDSIKDKIDKIVQVFENGKIVDYGQVSFNNDGPNGIDMLSYGVLQCTEWGGSLKGLIQSYVNACGKYSKQLQPYLNKIGVVSLYADTVFIELLRNSGSDIVMQDCQNIYFNNHYWVPAFDWFNRHDFTLNLSMLVIFDSFINSGSIRMDVRDMFSELTPDSDGDEKTWVTQYVAARKQWMANKGGAIARDHYRMDSIQVAINDNDWNLINPFSIVDNSGNKIAVIE